MRKPSRNRYEGSVSWAALLVGGRSGHARCGTALTAATESRRFAEFSLPGLRLDHRVERHRLDRPDGLPELATRAVPNEPLRTVAAVTTAIAGVAECDRSQRVSNTLDGWPALLFRQRLQLRCVHEAGEHGMVEHEALDGRTKHRGAVKVADDRRISQIALQGRVFDDEALDV